MIFVRMLLCALTLTLLALPAESWLFGGSSSSSSSSSSSGSSSSKSFDYPDNLSGRQLSDLLNSPVRTAEKVERPLNLPFPFSLIPAREPVSHTGVRVTLEDDSQWLVHKGPDFGRSSQTVVTSADNMSKRWRETGESRDFNGEKRVTDFVAAGGETYDLCTANCHRATHDMMNQEK